MGSSALLKSSRPNELASSGLGGKRKQIFQSFLPWQSLTPPESLTHGPALPSLELILCSQDTVSDSILVDTMVLVL